MALIYHYCSLEAFMSIIQNDCIWFGSVRVMNDASEMRYFRDAVVPGVREVLGKHNTFPDAGKAFMQALESFEYYAACFASDADDLYQWQSYGQAGRGLAIGFDADSLCTTKPPRFRIEGIGETTAPFRSTDPMHTVGLGKVIYADLAQVTEYANRLINFASKHASGGFETIGTLAMAISQFGAVIKSNRFEVESESRLLYAPTVSHQKDGPPKITGYLTDRKWRTGKYGLTPYFEYSGIRRAIRHVVTGPSCVEKAQGTYLLDFLSSHGLMGKVTLEDSHATLR